MLIGGAIVVEHRLQLRPGEAVERLALRDRRAEPLLVGLAVHDDEFIAELGEHADRGAASADDRAAAALGGDRPAEQQFAGLDLAAGLGDALGDVPSSGTSHRPSTHACFAPARTAPASARAPSSSPSAVTTIVLPAPVSPVTARESGPERKRRLGDDAEVANAELLNHRGPRPDHLCLNHARPAPSTR